MPATLLSPTRDNIYTLPTAIADALIALYNGGSATLVLPVTFATADAAILFTMPALGAVPTAVRARITDLQWEVTAGWTGGASSAIGCSSSNAAFNAKGSLLGGAAGDVAATLITASPGPFVGTVGTKLASQAAVCLVTGDTIRFDRITSAFTAGTGNVLVGLRLLPTS